MIINYFSNNSGAVIHKIHINGSSMKFSAWYNEKGDIIDAEGIDKLNRSHTVKKNSSNWIKLEEVGKKHLTFS